MMRTIIGRQTQSIARRQPDGASVYALEAGFSAKLPPQRPHARNDKRLHLAGSVIPPARSEAAFQRGLVVALVLNERRLLARERIL